MNFEISNIEVYGLEQSIIASGYPKSTKVDKNDINTETLAISDNDFNRASKLGRVARGTGHDCYLKGIIVQWDITATHTFWIQWLRHHFNDIISSQSKMHCITKFDIASQCHSLVHPHIISIVEVLKENYLASKSREDFHKLIYNLPMGFMLTARCTDNYLSLKTQYFQRKDEKLDEWHTYCDAIKLLPFFNYLVLGEE